MMIFFQLFIVFIQIGIFGFGGGYSMISLIQGQVVTQYHWMTMQEFTDVVAISQMTPGPIGINTVDSFDIHTSILDYRTKQMENCKKAGKVSVISAGWDPGSDSIVRVLMESLAPKGLTYTNFGPGMSMGHSVCVRSKKGVKEALSVTIPLGEGIHRRMVYVELEEGAKLEDVTAEIKADPYFAHDETHVFAVASVDDVKDMGHGVNLVRKGVSGKTQNQRFEFNMSINNPALTAQVLVNVARASFRLQPGCYTMPEIPVIDMLPGTREEIVATLV